MVDKVYPSARDPLEISYVLIIEMILNHQLLYFGINEVEVMKEAIFPVCSPFTELLDSLYRFEDEDE